MASDRRAMLEPVTAAASDDPAIAPLRVPVDQQVTIVAILILAYARLGAGAPGDIRETTRQIGPAVRDRSVGYAPVAEGGRLFRPVDSAADVEQIRRASCRARGGQYV